MNHSRYGKPDGFFRMGKSRPAAKNISAYGINV